MANHPRWPSEVGEHQRGIALSRYETIKPLLHSDVVPERRVSEACHVSKRSRSTIYLWLQQFRKGGIVALIPGRRARAGLGTSVDVSLRKWIQAWYLQRPGRHMRLVCKAAQEEAKRRGLKPPGYLTVWRICRQVPAAVRCMAKEGEKAYRDRFEPVARIEVDRPNRRWHVDHTKADILLRQPGRKPKRPWLTMVLDAYSRAPMGYHLSFDSPSTLSVSLALRMGILPKEDAEWPVCGIPSEIFVDNGQDLISDHMKTVAADLRFELIPGSDGHARHNGRLERFNRTLNTGLVCELPGYTGPNVTKRPEKVEAELTLREFGKRFRQWLIQEYMKSTNRTTKQTPLARWKSKQFVPRLPDSARQLDLLLVCDAKQRRVTHDGIHLFTHTYVAQQLFPIIGEWVVVRYDPRDLEEIQVYFRDQWIGTARSVDPDHPFTDVREMRRLQRERRREVHEELRRYEEVVRPAPKRSRDAKKRKTSPEPVGVGAEPKKKFYLYATDKLPWPE